MNSDGCDDDDGDDDDDDDDDGRPSELWGALVVISWDPFAIAFLIFFLFP